MIEPRLLPFRHDVTDLWRRTLRRRSRKDGITRTRMTQLVDAWLLNQSSSILGRGIAPPSHTPYKPYLGGAIKRPSLPVLLRCMSSDGHQTDMPTQSPHVRYQGMN